LRIGDVLQPLDVLAVEGLLNRDVGHGGGRRRAMPVFVPGRTPDDIARADLDNGLTLALRPAATGGDNQRLPQRMGVPGRARARLEFVDCMIWLLSFSA
jgi:hypothetical protein